MTDQNSAARGYAYDMNDEDPLEELARIVASGPARQPQRSVPSPQPQRGAALPQPQRAAAQPQWPQERAAVAPAPVEAGAEEPHSSFAFDIEAELLRELEGPAAARNSFAETLERVEAEPATTHRDTATRDEPAAEPDGEDADGEIDSSLEDQLMAELGFHGFDDTAVENDPVRRIRDEERRGDEPIDLAREFQEAFRSELAVGRAADALNRNAELAERSPDKEIEELFGSLPMADWTGGHSSSLDADIAALEATVAHGPAYAGDPTDESHSGSLHREDYGGEADWPSPAHGDPTADPAFVAAFEQELTQAQPAPAYADHEQWQEEPRAASPTQDARRFDSERDLEAHFASAFAQELDFDDEPPQPAARADARAMAPVGSRHAEAEEAPAYHDADDDGEDDVATVMTTRPAVQRGGFRLAGIALGVALVIGLGAVSYGYFSSGGSSESEPVVVKADTDPVKVKPDDPGGTKVANQDQAAYERISGKFEPEASQEKLVSAAEEPVDIAPAPAAPTESAAIASADAAALPADQPADAAVAGDPVRKAEERLVPQQQVPAATIATLEPRRVRTLTVRPDGTIIAPPPETAEVPTSETAFAAPGETAPATDLPEPIDGARTTGATTTVPEPRPGDLGLTSAPQTLPGVDIGASDNAEAPVPLQTRSIAVAPRAPEQQAAAETVQQQASLAAPQPSEPPATNQPVVRSEWAIQVSSQRSAEEAESAYRNLRARFPDLLQGRQMAVQRAEVDDKGVFYRVRIQAESKTEADDFCQRLKTAGGSCFVTR